MADEMKEAVGGFEENAAQLKEQEEFLGEITKDFKRLQKQKSKKTGGVEARVLLSRAFKWGEQYVTQQEKGLVAEVKDDNKLHLSFNLIDKICQKLTGRLTSIGGQFYTRPDKKDAKALADAEVCDKLILALDEKLDQPMRNWELIDTLLTDGVAFEYVPYIPNASIEPMPQFGDDGGLIFTYEQTGEQVPEAMRDEAIAQGVPPEQFTIFEEVVPVGDVGSEILSALNVFIDQGVKSVDGLAPDQAVYIAKLRTQGWIEENYPDAGEISYDDELKIVTTNFFQEGASTASLYLRDLIPMYQGSCGEDDPKMAVVVERYMPASLKNPKGHFTCFIPGKKILHDGENPYEEIPLVDFHLAPVTGTFWTKDFITDLIPPQKFLNKRISQMGEQANGSIYDKILLGGTLSSKDILADAPQAIEKAVNEQGVPMVQRLAGPQLPSWFLESGKMASSMLMQIAGGSDLMDDNSFPGQLRGPMAVPMLQELLDSQWGMLYQHLGQRMAKVKQMRLNRVRQFYEPIRTLHYTDNTQRDEVLTFHTEKILRSGTNFNVTVERGSLLPEFRALREARVRERLDSSLSVLYMDERTGQIDKSKVAADLAFSDFGREGKEAESRKFAGQLIDKMWKGEPVPQPMMFWPHETMMDELESQMMTTEWLAASPQVQELFVNQWNIHSQFLQQRAQMQAASQMQGAVQNAVAQATQQAAAMAASDTVNSVQGQLGAQSAANQQNPVRDMLQARNSQQGA